MLCVCLLPTEHRSVNYSWMEKGGIHVYAVVHCVKCLCFLDSCCCKLYADPQSDDGWLCTGEYKCFMLSASYLA
jgi:hypothetical protein